MGRMPRIPWDMRILRYRITSEITQKACSRMRASKYQMWDVQSINEIYGSWGSYDKRMPWGYSFQVLKSMLTEYQKKAYVTTRTGTQLCGISYVKTISQEKEDIET